MSAMDDILLNAPIPGSNLTAKFGSRPWHRPSEFFDPVDALDYHLDRLEESKVKKALITSLELGLSVKDLTLGILRAAVYDAKHDLDTLAILAPVIHEAIELMAEEADIEFKTGLGPTEDELREESEMEYSLNSMKASKLLEKHKSTGDLEGMTLESPSEPVTEPSMPVDDEEPMIEDNTPVEAPKGLMARKDM